MKPKALLYALLGNDTNLMLTEFDAISCPQLTANAYFNLPIDFN
jgi:hypothetical protein